MIAVLLTMALMLGLVGPVTALAADNNTINYVSLGDSTTNGYAFPTYYTDDQFAGNNVRGYLEVTDEAYPNLVANALAANHNCTVNLKQLAVSGFRVEELRAILDANYEGDDYTKGVFSGGENWFAVLGGEDALRAEYTADIQNADLITFNLGTNNFGTYFTGRLQDMLGMTHNNYDDRLSDLFVPASIMVEARKIQIQVQSMLNQIAGDNAGTLQLVGQLAGLPNVLAYCYAGFVINFTACMQKIYQLNPDVDMVVMALPNMLKGVKIQLTDGINIDVGALWGLMIGAANLYMRSGCIYSGKYAYVDASGYHRFVDELIDGQVSPTMEAWLWKEMNDKGIPAERYNDVLNAYYGAAQVEALPLMDTINNFGYFGGVTNDNLDTVLTDHSMYGALNIYCRFMQAYGIGVHPDAAGYQYVADTLMPVIEKLDPASWITAPAPAGWWNKWWYYHLR